MVDRRLSRWSGPALMLGGIFLGAHYATHPLGETPPYILSAAWIPAHFIGAVAWVLLLLGLAGLYAEHSERLGRLGLVGFILAFVAGATRPGELLVLGVVAGPLIAAQSPALLNPGGSLYLPLVLTVGSITFTYGAGFFLLAIATIRATIVPSWAPLLVAIAIPLALGTFLVFVIGSISGLIFSLGLFGWGYFLWKNKKPPC